MGKAARSRVAFVVGSLFHCLALRGDGLRTEGIRSDDEHAFVEGGLFV